MNNCLIQCGGLTTGSRPAGTKVITLDLNSNVNLRISDINKQMIANIPDELLDLLEIASYVYSADQAARRGGDGTAQIGAKWRRSFDFHIPVRCPKVWSAKKVNAALCETLGFLSDDYYSFTFTQLATPPVADRYFDFSPTAIHTGFQEVMLFSGGLDSLAGAIDEMVLQKKKIVLVSHRSSPKITKLQKNIVSQLRTSSPDFLHIPVWVHKDKALGKEYTQRTRSFLFASLAAVVARLLNLSRIRFYENGIVSFNLPISAQLIGSHASRTTHPQTLKHFENLFTQLFGTTFIVENPYVWKTKSEVVEVISNAGKADIIKYSTSCAHTWDMTRQHTHCGTCSQCIDRRFGTLASGNEANDPKAIYKVELFTGPRKDGVDRTLVESYIRNAEEIEKMNEHKFFSKFQELNRIFPHLGGNISQAATNVWNLYSRFAKQVGQVVDDGIKAHASDIRNRTLDESCLLAMVVRGSNKPAPPKIPTNTFTLPPGTTWGDIKLKFIDGHTLSISINGTSKQVDYNDMGMKDGRAHKPTKQWDLLGLFAEGYGTVTWGSSGADPHNQKRREILSKNLQAYFGIKEDPIEYDPSSKGWRTKFTIDPVS